MISTVLSDIATGLGTLVPAFFKALLDGFTGLFVSTTGEGASAVTKLTPVGEIAIVFIIIGMVYKIAPTVVGWLRLSMRKRKARKSKAR